MGRAAAMQRETAEPVFVASPLTTTQTEEVKEAYSNVDAIVGGRLYGAESKDARDVTEGLLSEYGLEANFTAPDSSGDLKDYSLVTDPSSENFGEYQVSDNSSSSLDLGSIMDVAAPVLSAIPNPFQPVAQMYQAMKGLNDGIDINDVLAITGAANIDNPISAITEGLNTALGIDPESAFALTDGVVANLTEGDLQGAALDYINSDMVDVNLDSSIGNALASFDDIALQPIVSLGNELLDPLQSLLEPVSETVSNIGSTIAEGAAAFEDAARTPITAVGDAVQAVANPVIQAVNTVGDVAQENIIDPIVSAGDSFQENIIDPVVETAAQFEDVVSEAIPSLPDTPDLSDIEYPDLTIDTPDINIPTPDLSFIPALFSDLLASTGTTATNTTDMKSLFSDDLFKFQNEIITV